MADSAIQWTDKTWNPTTGCTETSQGCKHCYAKVMHERLTAMGQKKYAQPFHVVQPWPAQLADPLKWKKPARIFVNSMSDLFHEDVPDRYIAAVFGAMAACRRHTFQVLTKRADRMAKWFKWVSDEAGAPGQEEHLCGHAFEDAFPGFIPADPSTEPSHFNTPWVWPLPNVHLGVSVENQEQAEARIPHLLRTPASLRFLSCEPLLGPLRVDDLSDGAGGVLKPLVGLHWVPTSKGMKVDGAAKGPTVDWVIVGGESGHGARPCSLEWVESIVRQCRGAEVPVFVKQLGAFPLPRHPGDIMGRRIRQYVNGLEQRVCIAFDDKKGGDIDEFPADLRVREFPAVRQ